MKRIFDTAGVGEICDEIKQILKDTQEYMEGLESVAEAARSADDSVPSYVTRTNISSYASVLKNHLSAADAEISAATLRLTGSRMRATEYIPEADSSYAEQTQELIAQVNNLRSAISQLNEFLAETPLSTDYATFEKDLSVARSNYQMVLGDTRRAIETLLDNIKGADKVSQVFSKDPVNLSTGNFIYDHTDLEIGGRSPFVFSRFYNAINRRSGVLGQDWNHNYEVFIEKQDGEVILVLEQGKEERFMKASTGAYASLHQSNGELEEAEGGYLYTTHDQKKYRFDTDGRYIKQESPDGTDIVLSYEEAEKTGKRLVKVERNTGEYFALSYDEAGYLCKVTDHTGRFIEYKAEDGHLWEVSTLSGGKISYEYSSEGKLSNVTNAVGIITVQNIYDEKMRTVKQTFPDGSSMSYAYDDTNRTVKLTERNGAETTYVHDEKYRDIKHIDSEGEERYEYNKRNQKTLVVDKLGHKTQFGYDEKGNLTRVINAQGTKMDFTYEAHNLPVSVYIDGKEKLRNRYNEAGELLETTDACGSSYQFTYERKNLPSKIHQPDSSEIKLAYDERGNITSITDAFDSVQHFIYDDLNRVTEATDGNGNKTSFVYDMAGNVIETVNAAGDTRAYQYNESGKVTEIRDYDGSIVKREYNVLNKPSKITDQEGNETLLSYDAMWNLARITEPNGAKTTYIYNGLNRLSRIRKPNGALVRYAYDAAGNRTGFTDEDGNKTQFAYDPLGRLIQVTDPEENTTFYEYDTEGNVIKVTDPLGNVTLLEYNGVRSLIKETNALGESRSYTYTVLGKIETITDEAGRVTRYEYEPGGRVKAVHYPDSTEERYTYDGNGNILTHRGVTGFVTTYHYDCLDRIIEITGDSGEKKSYIYDAVGNVTGVTDGLGNTTRYEYTLNGHLKKVTDALGNETEYDYDVCGRLIEIRQYGEKDNTVTDITGNAASNIAGIDSDLTKVQQQNQQNKRQICQLTRYERDISGQVTKITDALGQEEIYTYGKRGELLSKADKEGYLTTYGYTPNGEVNQIRYADEREVRLSYNALKQLTEMEDWLGITRIENDPLGRVTKVQYPDGQKVGYTYGKAGERTSITYPDGRRVSYDYDNLMRLSALRDGEKVINYAYNPFGQLAEKTFPNGMSTSYAYNEKGQLLSLIHKDQEGILDAYHYEYDILGNKTGIEKQRRSLSEESGSYAYGYDALGRLSSVAKDGTALRSYTYDAFGNRTGLTEKGQQTRYTYNALNQLISKADVQGEETYSYDKRGNLTQVLREGNITNRYVYGAINRLEEAVSARGERAQYHYNGLGYRVGKEVRGVNIPKVPAEPTPALNEENLNPEKHIRYTIDFTRQYHNLLQKEENGQNQTYLWDGNVTGVYHTDGNTPLNVDYYLQDELGSPIRLLDESGILHESYGYDEFGSDLYGNQGQVQPFGYTGYQHDSVAGTYFAQAREYRPVIGRFAARDIIKGHTAEPCTMNAYGYCWNNPLVMVDLNGLNPEIVYGILDKLIEGNEAHRLLQAEFQKDYGGKGGYTEYHISSGIDRNPSGTGRADIVYFNSSIETAEVYEIKPGVYAPNGVLNKEGLKQLKSYMIGLAGSEQVSQDWRVAAGTSLKPYFHEKVIESRLYENKEIVYRMYEDGMIIYSYRQRPHKELVYAVAPDMEESGERKALKVASGVTFTAALLMLLGTLAEDFITGGVGISNDAPAFAAFASVFVSLFGNPNKISKVSCEETN